MAGTFPYLAESIFPQTPYFNKDIGDLQGIRHVHVPISIFLTGMQTLRGQRVDFRLHILHGNGEVSAAIFAFRSFLCTWGRRLFS